jgi:hypothetical protein
MDEEDYRSDFTKLFDSLDEKRAKEIDESTLKLIDHVHGRVSYTDEKHRTSLELNIALLTFSAALGVFLNGYNTQWLMLGSPLVVGLFTVSISGIILFVFQDRFKRPFIEVAQTWRWFYHYSIDPKLPAGPFLCSEQRENSKKGYLEGLYKYAKNTLTASPQKILKQDVEQLFVLLTTERLKNEFLKQSQGVLGYGFIASIASLGLNMLLAQEKIQFGVQASILIFLVIFVITVLVKVLPTTRSRKQWNYIEETKSE